MPPLAVPREIRDSKDKMHDHFIVVRPDGGFIRMLSIRPSTHLVPTLPVVTSYCAQELEPEAREGIVCKTLLSSRSHRPPEVGLDIS